MEKRNLYIVVVIVLVVGLVLSFTNLTGLHTKIGGPHGRCFDSDNGKEFHTTGMAWYENRDAQYKDYCFARSTGPKRWLNEYYCTPGNFNIKSEDHLCENGCQDGACIE